MAKKSDLQTAIDKLDAEILVLDSAREVLYRLRDAKKPAKARTVKPKPSEAQS